jgi:NAD(P)-dependent dehydrogenase (short-subunit alcohol dehydrogenase family)
MRGSAVTGRSALVSGGVHGIGAAIATAMGSAGARVLVADIDDAPIQCDLRRPGEGRRMVEEAVERMTGRDGLANNAGGYSSRRIPIVPTGAGRSS